MEFTSNGPDPERVTHENIVLEKVMEIIDNELSDRQKLAMKPLMIQGMSMTVVAEQMAVNRNALYKLVHDARVKLKRRMEAEGMDPDEILNRM